MHAASRVALRVDASATMGTGHLRRCLSLAQALVELGAVVDLLVRRHDEVAPQVLSSPALTKGLGVYWLPAPTVPYVLDPNSPPHQAWASVNWEEDAAETVAALADLAPNWLVVDHYAFDERWHATVRDGLLCRVLVIDDVADRNLDADVLLDQNWHENHRVKYEGRLRHEPIWMTGPSFALLDKAYSEAPRYRFRDEVSSLGIFMGGADPGGSSARILKICRASGFVGLIEVVSTSANPHLPELRSTCAAWSDTILTLDEPNLAGFFARHDLQIGAGGSATWERCCMAVPFIALVLAENQRAVLEPLRKMGVVQIAEGDDDDLVRQIHSLIVSPEARRQLGDQAGRLVDGKGTLRVAELLLQPC